MEKNKQLVPKRRFKEFENDGDWEQKKLGDLVNLENGYAFKSKYFISENTGYVVVTPGNVQINGGFNKKQGRNYDPKGNIPSQYIFKPGDLFITMTDLTPTAETLGNPAIIPDDDVSYLHNQRLGKLSNPVVEISFLFALLSTQSYHQEIVKTASGTTVKHSSPERILNVVAHIPSMTEQNKIGSYFQKLDNLINIQNIKIKKINQLKESYLSDMFPKEGEKYPKKRFEGFTEPWEEYQLGELSDIVRGASPRPIKDPKWFDSNSNVGWLRISDVTEQDGFLIFLDPKFDKEFMFQWLEMFRAKWKKYGQPGSQVNLNSDIVKNQNVTIPSKEEQVKIASFFKNLDAQINIEEQKLEKLEQLKQAYLNELFV